MWAFRFHQLLVATYASLFFLSAPALGSPQSIQVPFHCPQALSGRSNPDIPSNFTFNLTFDFTPIPTLEWEEWRSVAARAIRSDTDYFDCFMTFQESVRLKLNKYCLKKLDKAKNTGTEEQRCSDEIVPSMLADLRLFHARLGQAAVDNHALPPYPPGVPVTELSGLLGAGSSSMEQTEWMRETASFVSEDCSVGRYPLAMTSEFVAGHLSRVLGQASPGCRQSILRSYLSRAAQLQPDRPRCERTESRLICDRYRLATQRFLTLLSKHFSQEMGDELTSGQIAACLDSKDGASAFFLDLGITLQSALSCVTLKPGEARIVEELGTGIKASYALSRDRAGEYTATINARFFPKKDQQEWTEKVNQCLSDLDGRLSPIPGTPLKVRVSEKAIGDPPIFAPSTSISITDVTGHRDNSELWSTTIDCNTIAHELFHKLGLPDTYPERSSGYLYNPITQALHHVESQKDAPKDKGVSLFLEDDCRSIGPEVSVMNRPEFAIGSKTDFITGFCTCPENLSKKACDSLLGTVIVAKKSDSCPSGTQATVSNGTFGPPIPAPSRAYGFVQLSKSDRHIQGMLNVPNERPILWPAEFRAITQPGCAAANSVYYACSQSAYSTSRAHLGKGCPKGMPSVCSNPEVWLK
jgi:hypothetical protein